MYVRFGILGFTLTVSLDLEAADCGILGTVHTDVGFSWTETHAPVCEYQ